MKACRRLALGLAAGLITAAIGLSAAGQELRVVHVSGHERLLDPEAAFWGEIQPVAIAMLPQVVTTPQNAQPGVNQLQVKAAHDGHRISFHIEWSDSTRSDRIVVDQFGDQVAVEMPIVLDPDRPPSPMMGNPGGRVTIWQWRAAFQRDLDESEPQLRDLYPYAQVDVYPDEVLHATDARPYTGALGLDNPVSQPHLSPVLDQMAEGWGTLTLEPEGQDADGKGVWRDGVWQVVIAHPMGSARGEDIELAPGSESLAAFAVWDGGNREVGARKAWSVWVPVKLEQ